MKSDSSCSLVVMFTLAVPVAAGATKIVEPFTSSFTFNTPPVLTISAFRSGLLRFSVPSRMVVVPV